MLDKIKSINPFKNISPICGQMIRNILGLPNCSLYFCAYCLDPDKNRGRKMGDPLEYQCYCALIRIFFWRTLQLLHCTLNRLSIKLQLAYIKNLAGLQFIGFQVLLFQNALNTKNNDDSKLHMMPFVTAVVQTSILLIQDVITDYVDTIHLYAAGLEINQSRKLKTRYGARNRFQEPSLELSSQSPYF